MRKRKIRAKVVFFRELREICVKKSDVFGRDGRKTESKLYTKDYQKDGEVTCLPVYYAGLM